MKLINRKAKELVNVFKEDSDKIKQIQLDIDGIVVIIQDIRTNEHTKE